MAVSASSNLHSLGSGLVLILLFLTLPAAAQSVRWEDYRGIANSSGLANTTYSGPASAPTFDHTLAGVNPAGSLCQRRQCGTHWQFQQHRFPQCDRRQWAVRQPHHRWASQRCLP